MYIKFNNHLYNLDHFQQVKIVTDPNRNGTMYLIVLTTASTQREITFTISRNYQQVEAIFNVILSYLKEHKDVIDFTDYTDY